MKNEAALVTNPKVNTKFYIHLRLYFFKPFIENVPDILTTLNLMVIQGFYTSFQIF